MKLCYECGLLHFLRYLFIFFLHTQSKIELNTLALLVQELKTEQKSIRCHFWGGISGPTETL